MTSSQDSKYIQYSSLEIIHIPLIAFIICLFLGLFQYIKIYTSIFTLKFKANDQDKSFHHRKKVIYYSYY